MIHITPFLKYGQHLVQVYLYYSLASLSIITTKKTQKPMQKYMAKMKQYHKIPIVIIQEQEELNQLALVLNGSSSLCQ